MKDTIFPDTQPPPLPHSILFVCTGNICRSPTAEGVMRHALATLGKSDKFRLDSAGVESHHIGQPPDPRSQQIAKLRGVDISDLRARNVTPDDFSRFDLILAMDQTHLNALNRMVAKLPSHVSRATIGLYLPYAGIAERHEVPDPYYGTANDFIDVFDLINDATNRLIKRISP